MNEKIIVAITKLNEIVTDIDKDDTCFLDIKDTVEEVIALLKAKDTNVPTKWRKIEFREPDEEEKANHPEWNHVKENAPDDGEEILASDGRYVWKDEFCDNGDECYLDSGHEMEGCWWMPLPEPPKESESE